MGVFKKTRSYVPELDQDCRLNGLLTRIIECVSHTADSAQFRAPTLLFDTRREYLRNGLATVYVKGATAFTGYLDVDSAEADPESDEVTLTGNSITHYLSKVWVGQDENVPVVIYTMSEKMNPKRVLKDIFDKLPSGYRSRIKLGNTSVLRDNDIEVPPQLVFRNATIVSAIDQILALFGDVAYTERPAGSVVYLDFYRIQDPTAPRTVAIVSPPDGNPLNANVEQIGIDTSSVDSVTRVKIYGAPRKFIVSCITNHPDPLKALKKDWDTSLEAAVKASPKKAKPGAPGYVAGMEWVFRRYRLPDCLVPYTKLKDLPFKRENGNDYQPQAWIYGTTLSDAPAEEPTKDKIGTLNTAPTLITGVKFELNQNQIVLSNPALNITEKKKVDNKLVTTYQEAVVGVTFAFESRDYIYYDTGHDYGSDVDMDFAVEDGLTESIHREDLYYAQYTNIGYPVKAADETTNVEFGAIIFNEDTPTAPPQTVSEVLVVHDDIKTLKRLALEKQRERSKSSRTYKVGLMYYTRAYRPGYLLEIQGQDDYVPDNYMITSVTYDIENHSTSITADNVKPPARQEVK